MKESTFLEKILAIGRKIIPRKIFRFAQPIYHYALAIAGATIYRFPAKKMVVIGVTGTKGKSTTTELVNAILEADGKETALASTIRYKIGKKEWRNMFKMTLRGRFFTQSFLRKALNAGCTHAIIEMSSEGVPQFRHKFLFPDVLIFTNLAPEHIESHGSYENYVRAKISIAKELATAKEISSQKVLSSPQSTASISARLFSKTFLSLSKKPNTAIIANADDKEGEKFLTLNIKNKIPYSLSDAINVKADESGSSFQIDKTVIHSKLPGVFNVYNMLGAIACAKFLGVKENSIKKGLESLGFIRGRMEKIENKFGIDIVVDYAHTPDSLKAVYETYKDQHSICVLGNTGGGRDKWKRKEMGKIADQYCDRIILTNEDPYDEDPRKIVEEMKGAVKNKPVEIIMDRREAINGAIRLASLARADQNRYAVLITGKGTDPYIMEANGKKIPWDDATVVREELQKISQNA